MTSKEALNSIADKFAIKEYDKYGNLIKWVGTIDKEYLTIMKDLEILEKYERIMSEPILDVMKELEQLDTIKSWLLENVEDYTNEEHPNYFIDVFIRDDEPIFNIIKEVLKWKE